MNSPSNNKKKSSLSSPTKKQSPTGVIQEALQHCDGIPAIPDISETPQRKVRFSESPSYIDSELKEEDFKNMWSTKEEIQIYQREAKQEAKEFRERQTNYIRTLEAFFQDCKGGSSCIQRVLRSPNAQGVSRLSQTPVRGLEGHLHTIVGQNRILHLRTVLAVQRTMKSKRAPLENFLRASSLHSSRTSRALARLLAEGDHAQVAAIIRDELLSRHNRISV